MKAIRKPLKKSILQGFGLFAATLCVFLAVAQFFFLRNTLYSQYQTRLTYILKDAESVIDVRDLAECIRTGQESEKFAETQRALDAIKSRTGVQFLYVIIPLNTEERDNVRNVMAAVAEFEKDDPAAYVQLNALTGDDYPAAVAKKYLEAYGADGISFFENKTEFGTDYTGLLVLKDGETGERVAALCADFEAGEIRGKIRENLLDIVIIVVILGFLFATAFMIWADRHIVQPVRTLEKDVTRLAQKSRTSRNPDALVYSAEGIRTGNEVESLARAVENLSVDMRDYVRNLVDQEKELVRLNAVVNRDVLTHVGNRNAYDQYAEGLQLKMTEGRIEFGILLVDPNRLSRINTDYGHDKGDMYLQKACRVICEVFRHSPVFRVGGDEFAVILTDGDFVNRRALIEETLNIFYKSASDEKTPPWEQVSVEYGIAEYSPIEDRTVKDVYERAKKELSAKKEWLHTEGKQ